MEVFLLFEKTDESFLKLLTFRVFLFLKINVYIIRNKGMLNGNFSINKLYSKLPDSGYFRIGVLYIFRISIFDLKKWYTNQFTI